MQDFQAWLHAIDFHPPSIILDGKIQRFGRNGGKDNAWLIGWQNTGARSGKTFIVALVGDWRQGAMHEYKPEGKGITAEDKAVMAVQIKRAQEAAAEAKRQRQLAAAARAGRIWGNARAGSHPYAERKGIEPDGLRIDGETLLVPMRDLGGEIHGLQRIAPDGTKRFVAGQRVDGTCFLFGQLTDESAECFLVEGWATGGSVALATGKPVVCAFNASNLITMALALKARWPRIQVTVAGDDDRFIEPNVGREKGTKAALAAQGTAVFPRFLSDEGKPTDWNDLHAREGLDAVRAQLVEETHEQETGFVPLGYDEATHFFYHVPSKDIVKASTFSDIQMFQIAPLAYWEMAYPTKQGTANMTAARNAIMQASRAVGPFDSSLIRGTGVWIDEARIVVNTGAGLVVDGAPLPLTALKTRHVYVQSRHRIPSLARSPLTPGEGGRLTTACLALRWKEPHAGYLLAGWLALARVAAALPVRPHVWVTGGKGTGKSTLMEWLVAPALGSPRGKLYLQGGTTEAGIRQTLKASSIPIIFDEFETTASTRDRIESIIELMRNAWSQTQGFIVKGSAGGHAVEFQLGFAALVSSIRIGLTTDADRSRFSILELDQHGDDKGQWRALQKALAPIDEAYGERLFARAVARVHVLLDSQRHLAAALAEVAGQRYGQQVGTLLAGWWMLEHDEVITEAAARSVVKDLKLVEELADATQADEDDCLMHLYSTNVTLAPGAASITIGAAIRCNGWVEALKQLGIKIDNGRAIIANKHAELERIYRGTRWAGNWSWSLARVPGATRVDRCSFGSRSVKSRAVSIPID